MNAMQNITPQKLQSLLSLNYNTVNLLLQRYRLIGPVNVQTIQQGYNTYGRRFAQDLAAILAMPTGTLAGYDGEVTTPTGTGSNTSGGNSTAFWSTMNTLLGYAYQVYENEKGGGSTSGANGQQYNQTAIPESIAGIPLKTLIVILGAALAAMMVFLIVKK